MPALSPTHHEFAYISHLHMEFQATRIDFKSWGMDMQRALTALSRNLGRKIDNMIVSVTIASKDVPRDLSEEFLKTFSRSSVYGQIFSKVFLHGPSQGAQWRAFPRASQGSLCKEGPSQRIFSKDIAREWCSQGVLNLRREEGPSEGRFSERGWVVTKSAIWESHGRKAVAAGLRIPDPGGQAVPKSAIWSQESVIWS